MAELPDNAIHPQSRAAWRAWLLEHYTRANGVWVVTWRAQAARTDTTKVRLEYDDIVEEALCFGWIDSKPGSLDAERTMLWVSPRKAKSGWSRPNKERIERMLAAGLMHPAGLAKIEAAKADGSWSKLDVVETLEIPPDLAKELALHPPAAENFEQFPRSARRGILEWIAQAKRPETRAKRIAETARLARDNVRANQWSPKK